jgi:hypothetical protein
MFALIRYIFRNDLLAGCFFIALSYLPFLLPKTSSGMGALAIGASFYLGALFIANYVIKKLGGRSIVSLVRGSPKNNQNFTFISIALGAFMGFIASDLGGLWYFPYWSATTYFVIGFILGGWAFYFLVLIACYEAMKLFLDRVLPQRERVTSYFSYEKHLYSALFWVGCACLTVVGVAALASTKLFTSFHYTVNTSKQPYLAWYFWIISFLGMFFICEYVEYRRKRSSLIKDTIHGYFNPLLAVILVGVLLAITNEVQNFDVFLWRYANYPLAGHHLFNIPIFIIMAWPLHIIALLVFWRAFGNGSSSVVFANSKYHPAKKKFRPGLSPAYAKAR